jgi:hypothetical protein
MPNRQNDACGKSSQEKIAQKYKIGEIFYT